MFPELSQLNSVVFPNAPQLRRNVGQFMRQQEAHRRDTYVLELFPENPVDLEVCAPEMEFDAFCRSISEVGKYDRLTSVSEPEYWSSAMSPRAVPARGIPPV